MLQHALRSGLGLSAFPLCLSLSVPPAAVVPADCLSADMSLCLGVRRVGLSSGQFPSGLHVEMQRASPMRQTISSLQGALDGRTRNCCAEWNNRNHHL